MKDQHKAITPCVIVRLLFFLLSLFQLAAFDFPALELVGGLGKYAHGHLEFCLSRMLVARRYPELIAERARYMQQKNAKL